jgi:hypothetical protein
MGLWSDVIFSCSSRRRAVSVLHPSSEEGDGATWVAICRSCKKSHLEAQSSSAKNSEHMAAPYLAHSPYFVCRAVIGVMVDPDDVVNPSIRSSLGLNRSFDNLFEQNAEFTGRGPARAAIAANPVCKTGISKRNQ